MAIVELEGNNGGDIFEMHLWEDEDVVTLIVGHQCVKMIDHVVPVEFLTAVLAKAVLDAGGVIEAMQAIDWPEEYKKQLVAKIEKA